MSAAPKAEVGSGKPPEPRAVPAIRDVIFPAQLDTMAVAAAVQAKAAIEVRFAMALQQPRDWTKVRAKLLEACARPEFAERARYKKPVGRGDKARTLDGPSIRFAEECLRAMGNAWAPSEVVSETPEQRIIRVTVTDLEANLTFPVDVVIQKTVERKALYDGEVALSERVNSKGKTVYTVAASEDSLLNKQNALVSKAMRTGVGRIFPDEITEAAMVEVKATLAKLAGDQKQIEKLVRAFAALDVPQDHLEGFIGVEVERFTPQHFEDLRGIYQAIKDGETTWKAVMEQSLSQRPPTRRTTRPVARGSYAEGSVPPAEVSDPGRYQRHGAPPADPYLKGDADEENLDIDRELADEDD